jgi:starch synthase (maltosyl-transferring)
VRLLSFKEAGQPSYVNGITVNKSFQLVEGAAGGAFHFEDIYPAVDCSRFPVKRITGEAVEVWADIYRDGYGITKASLVWRRDGEREWRSAPMTLHDDDRWVGSFAPEAPGRYAYAVEAWSDEFATWRCAFVRKHEAGADTAVDAIEGAGMLTKARAGGPHATAVILRQCETFLQTGDVAALLTEELKDAMAEGQFRSDLSRSQLFPLVVDRARAGFGAWYEMMPRSQGGAAGKYATFKDCTERLADIAAMGFDVICLPPIHPIGWTHRKGRDNTLPAMDGDPGSPYAIGAARGGHDAVHPELGTLDDFRDFIAACAEHNLEVALTFAAQCSPDHPWVREHPQWFKRRPDGSLYPAENPSETCEDIVVFDFACEDSAKLWNALRDVVLFWVEQGVKMFRADNPQTRPLPFWEWLIQEVKRRDPDVIFLAEAFARPKLMKGLAKLGFSQSYTSFTSCTSKQELAHYLGELTCYPTREYFRPNFFTNTTDILPRHLQSGEAWMFKSRAALAAMLSAAYGIYNGFELLEHEALPGSEEYRNSDKFEIKPRDWDGGGNIKSYLGLINRIRRENAGLQQTATLRFIAIDDGNVIGFVKQSADLTNAVAIVIALSRDVRDIWLPIGDTKIDVGGERRHVAAVENLVSGARTVLDWGGLSVRIEPDRDPAVFLRCLA